MEARTLLAGTTTLARTSTPLTLETLVVRYEPPRPSLKKNLHYLGESLPSDVTVVQVPIIPEGGVAVGLTWDAIPGADYYRVYRSVSPDAISVTGFLSNVNDTSFVDLGYTTVAGSPLAAGSVGVWHPVANLNTARGGHQSPFVSAGAPNQYYLYAMGGNDGTTFFSSVEIINVTVVPPSILKDTETQTLSTWTTDSNALPSVMSDFRAYVLVEYESFSISRACLPS